MSQLAGVSVSWYTWLEQGRPISVSDQVLESIARILRLDWRNADTYSGLHEKSRLLKLFPTLVLNFKASLILLDCVPHIFSIRARISSREIKVLVRFLPTIPSSGLYTLSSREKNIIWSLFTLPSRKKLLPDWENEAKRCVALFRFSSDQYVGKPWYTEFIDDLKSASPQNRGRVTISCVYSY